MAIEIRDVGPGDAGLFDRVAADVFDEPVDRKRLAACLASPGHMMIVALDGDTIVGQCAGMVHRHPDKPTELYVDEVGVAPTHQRRGIAGLMLDRLLARGRELGCEEAWVGTEPDNEPARRLYGRRGEPPEPFVMFLMPLGPDAG